MKKMMKAYLEVIRHPFKVYTLRDFPQFYEVLLINWFMKMLHTFYYFCGLHFSFYLIAHSIGKSSLIEKLSQQKFIFFSMLFAALFYPLIFWLYTKFWGTLLNFFSLLFGKVESDVLVTKTKSEEVAYLAMTSSGLYAIPLIGAGLIPFLFLLQLYAGMRAHLKFSNMQALFVLVSPLFIVLFILLFIFLYFAALFSLFT